jgi:hypothetical protein
MLQAGRSRFRFQMRLIHFSIDLTLPAALWPWVDSASNRNEYQESSWGVKGGWQVRKAVNLTAICESVVYKMWESRRLTTLWVSMASYRDSFTFFLPLCFSTFILFPRQ